MTAWPQSETLATMLATARRTGQQIEALPEALVPPDAETAYAVNIKVAEQLKWPTLGWKIARTTAHVREKLNISEPIYGRTYKRFAHETGTTLPHKELLDPLVECEFFVSLAAPLDPRDTPWTRAEIFNAVGEIHSGVEVAECRFPMAALPPLPAVLADGAASGRYVFGDRINVSLDELADVDVVLEVDGAIIRRGTGADVMEHPITPLLWLAETRRKQGLGLAAGAMISTGSCTGMVPIRAGQRLRVTFGDSAAVAVSFGG
jgi:2-keto-4-pentenoate hydratase